MKFEKISKEASVKYINSSCDFSEEEIMERIIDYDNLELPKRSSAKAGGYDFVLPIDIFIQAHSQILIPTFMKIDLDADKILEIYPRSSYGIKKGLVLSNTVGIIDADYYNNPDNEGHIMVCMKNTTDDKVFLQKGVRFCQGIIKQFFLVDGDEYGSGENRKGGFGSSGE